MRVVVAEDGSDGLVGGDGDGVDRGRVEEGVDAGGSYIS